MTIRCHEKYDKSEMVVEGAVEGTTGSQPHLVQFDALEPNCCMLDGQKWCIEIKARLLSTKSSRIEGSKLSSLHLSISIISCGVTVYKTRVS